MKALYSRKWSQLIANKQRFVEFLLQLGKVDGFALIVLGLMLFGLQTMVYMTPKQLVTGRLGFSTAKLEYETYPVPGILGTVSLMAGIVIVATRRRVDEPEAKHAVK